MDTISREERLAAGPVDPSVLTEQRTHRSHIIWRGEGLDERLDVRSSQTYWATLGVNPHPLIIAGLRTTGFYGLHTVGTLSSLDHHLITAMIERWRRETHTFHLPVGEATITLQDVEVLLGVGTRGRALVRPDPVGYDGDRWCDTVERLLGRRPVQSSDGVYKGTLNASWLIEQFQEGLHPDMMTPEQAKAELTFHLRAHMLLLAHSFLVDYSKVRIRLYLLLFLEELDEIHEYSWGSAILAYLYRHMCQAAQAGKVQIGGALILLQLWVYERIPSLAPQCAHLQVHDVAYGRRWTGHLSYTSVPSHSLRMCRYELELLSDDGFVWQPYLQHEHLMPPYCLAGRDFWCVRGPLICHDIVEWHYADRVMRQFGFPQHIPQSPDPRQRTLHQVSRLGRSGTDWATFHFEFIQLWTSVSPIMAMGRVEDHDAYIRWYHLITRRFIANPGERLSTDGFRGSSGSRHRMVDALTQIVQRTSMVERGCSDSCPITTLARDIERLGRAALTESHAQAHLEALRNEETALGAGRRRRRAGAGTRRPRVTGEGPSSGAQQFTGSHEPTRRPRVTGEGLSGAAQQFTGSHETTRRPDYRDEGTSRSAMVQTPVIHPKQMRLTHHENQTSEMEVYRPELPPHGSWSQTSQPQFGQSDFDSSLFDTPSFTTSGFTSAPQQFLAYASQLDSFRRRAFTLLPFAGFGQSSGIGQSSGTVIGTGQSSGIGQSSGTGPNEEEEEHAEDVRDDAALRPRRGTEDVNADYVVQDLT